MESIQWLSKGSNIQDYLQVTKLQTQNHKEKIMANTDGIELRKLVCNEEFKPRWEPYTLPDLGPDEVRVKSEFIAAKHGTEKGEVLGQAIYQHVPYLGEMTRSSIGQKNLPVIRRSGEKWAIRQWVQSSPSVVRLRI